MFFNGVIKRWINTTKTTDIPSSEQTRKDKTVAQFVRGRYMLVDASWSPHVPMEIKNEKMSIYPWEMDDFLRTCDSPGLPGPAGGVLLPGLDKISRSRVTIGCQIPVKRGIRNEKPILLINSNLKWHIHNELTCRHWDLPRLSIYPKWKGSIRLGGPSRWSMRMR